MKDICLSPRISMLAQMVPQGSKLCDVGTDYAYLPVWLVEHGRCPSAIASDLRPGPLLRAQKTVMMAKLESSISLRLGDGLASVAPEECTVISIAGMGGETISYILNQAPWLRRGKHLLLLQPQTRAEMLRQYLWQNGYRIEQERLCIDEHRFYLAMQAKGGGEALAEKYIPIWQCYFSQALLQEPLAAVFLKDLLVREKKAFEGMQKSKRKPIEKIEEKRKTIQWIEQVLGGQEKW